MFATYRSLPSMYDDLQRCNDCCKGDYMSYHCPLCTMAKYKPKSLSKVKKHLAVHWNARVAASNGLYTVTCHLHHESDNQNPGINKRHYHCPTCHKIIIHKTNLEHHVTICKGQVQDENQKTVTTENSTSSQEEEHVNGTDRDNVTSTAQNRTKVKVTCDICGKSVSIRWLKSHKRTHTRTHSYITEARHHRTVIISAKEGIFCASKNLKGPSYPVHIIKKTTDDSSSFCDNQSCIQLKNTANRGNNISYECPHLLSTPYAVPGKPIRLKEESLLKMKEENFITEQRYDQLFNFKKTETNSPLVVEIPSSESSSDRFIYLSIYTGTTHYWSKIGRTVVTFDKDNNIYTCKCSPSKRYCLHKAVTKWVIFQENPRFFTSSTDSDNDQDETNTQSDLIDEENIDEDPLTNNASDDQLNKSHIPTNLEYIHSKRIPPNLTQECRQPKPLTSVRFSPFETNCHRCNSNLCEEISSTKAKVVTMTGIYKDICTYWKMCLKCRCSYMYHEWTDGYHNYNNKLILGLDICLFLRAGVQNHVALGRNIDVLSVLLDKKLNSKDIVNGYLHFETMTDHSYDFCCVLCGYHPPVMIWDTFRKARFRFAVSEMKVPECQNEQQTVDADMFWNKVEKSILCRGLNEDLAKQLAVQPNYECWAPWIGKKSRLSNELFNTEAMKCSQVNAEEMKEPMPEEVLSNLLIDEKITNVRRICKEMGVRSDGSRMDIIVRLRDMSVTKSSFDNAYEKVFGCTGGWAVGCCPHGIVYAVKNLLRSESPRDYVDLEASLKHRPNVSICDIAHLIASHGNKRFQDFYSPHNGRLDEISEDTIAAVESGQLVYSLPYLTTLHDKTQSSGNNGQNTNPCTGSTDHLALYDWFHQLNCKKRDDILRRCSALKEIGGLVDTQAVEQLFSSSKRDVYFLNNFTAGNHMFLFRLIYHLRNTSSNKLIIERQEKSFGESLNLNKFGQLSQKFDIGEEPSSDTEDQSPPAASEDEIVYEAVLVNDDIPLDNHQENANDRDIIQQVNEVQVCDTEYNVLMKYHADEFKYLQDIAQATFSSLGTCSNEEEGHFQRNLHYANRILFQSATEDRHSQVCTENTLYGPFQSQGQTNYCGLCCVNNAIGIPPSGPVVKVADMDEAADKLWLDMVYNPCYGLTSITLEPMRDREGFYSYEVIQYIIQQLGFNLLYVDNRILDDTLDGNISFQLLHELQTIYGEAILIIRLKSFQHWISVKLVENRILLLDSSKRSPAAINHAMASRIIRDNINPPGAVLFLVSMNSEKLTMINGVVPTSRDRLPFPTEIDNSVDVPNGEQHQSY